MDLFSNPAFTLFLGIIIAPSKEFFSGWIKTKRDIKKRRWAEKESSYKEVFEGLYKLFTGFHSYIKKEFVTIYENKKIYKDGQVEETKVSVSKIIDFESYFLEEFNKFEDIIYKNSLYLKPKTIEKLLEIKSNFGPEKWPDIYLKVEGFELEWAKDFDPEKNKMHTLRFLIKYIEKVQKNWKIAQDIMNDMREEINLDTYTNEMEIFKDKDKYIYWK